jgi:hypothetical protein
MQPAEYWLLTLADPERQGIEWPRKRLDTQGIFSLCLLAELHGVLPNVGNQIERLLAENPERLMDAAQTGSKILPQLEPMRRRLAERSAMSLFLGAETRKLVRELKGQGVKIIVLRGMDFASRLYAQPALRPFIDVDLLIHEKDWKNVSSTLARLGYLPREIQLKHAEGYSERTWEHPTMPGAMIEVHDNLVNSPTVRRGVSVRLEDLPLERDAKGFFQPTPAGLFIIAAVHSAASHGFDKLQHLCDIAQIARSRAGRINESELRECAAKTGAGFCVAVGLDLAARAFDDSASAELLARLNFRWPRRFTRWLVTPALVVRSQGPRRYAGSWRRQLLRQMLKSRR